MASSCDETRERRLYRQGAASSERGAHRSGEGTHGSGRPRAYLAAYHAAQAFIFDRTGKAAKTHSGVRSEFARLAKDEPEIERAFPTFLARAYAFKETADYAIGHQAGVSGGEAEQAIKIATSFVDRIAGLISVGEE